ncbi:MAG: hypothetical protein KIT73_04585 [Burkholderiales bacterium]|nr:hypothetical protein [Burkholderiales bacterium]
MHDGIAHVRTLVTTADEAAVRLGAAARRWDDDADAARAMWDAAAGRTVFQRFLEPERAALASAVPALSTAVEGQRLALERAAVAAEAAMAATADAELAMVSANRARQQASAARGEIAVARGEAGRARSLTQSVTSRLGALGGG